MPEISETVKGSFTMFFGTVILKIFDGKSWYYPPPSYPNFFDTRNQCNSKGFPYGNFRHCETKKFRRKILIFSPPLLSINFSLPEIFWNTAQKVSTTKFFGTVRQKVFDGKSWYSPPPLIHKLFRYRKFSETQHRRLPVRNFSALWDKKISTENLDTTPPSLIQTFSAPEINATVKDSPTEIFGTVRQKIFDGKFWYSPLPSHP